MGVLDSVFCFGFPMLHTWRGRWACEVGDRPGRPKEEGVQVWESVLGIPYVVERQRTEKWQS